MSLDFLERDPGDKFDKYYSSNFASGDIDSEPIATVSDQPTNGVGLYSPKDNKTKFSKNIINKIKKHKFLALAGGGLGAGTFLLIILLFLAAQQLPGFAALIADVNMAKDNQLFERDTTEITGEKAALDAETPENQAKIEADYTDTGNVLSDLNEFSPNEVLGDLGSGNLAHFNYADGVLQEVDIDGVDVAEHNTNDISQWENGTEDASDTLTTSTTTVPELMNQLGSLDENGGLVIREGTATEDIQALEGDSLGGIEDSSQYDNMTADQADVQLDEDAQNSIDPSALNPNDLSETDALSSAEEDAIKTEATDATNTTDIENIVKDGGVDDNVETTIDTDLSGLTDTSSTVAKLDIAYMVAVPLCIIYDGSIVNSKTGNTIDDQNNEVESTYVFTESTADQEKAGDLSAQAIGAINRKLSNLDESNPEIDASGGTADTLNNIVSPQAGSGANYSINSIFKGSLGSKLNPILSNFCPILTNKYLAYGILVTQLINFFDGITEVEAAAEPIVDAIVEDAVEGTVDSTVDAVTSSAGKATTTTSAYQYIQENGLSDYLSALSSKVSNYTDSQGNTGIAAIIKTAQKKIATTGAQITGIAGVTYGLTLLAHEDVEQSLGTTYNGYSEGTAYADQADEGGNALSNEEVQKQYYGVPLSPSQVSYNKASDLAYLSKQNGSKSTYQRYFALSNPFSLFSRISTTAYADITNFSFRGLIEKVASVFNPTKLVSGIFTLFRGNRLYATASIPAPDTTDYGIVQWGYTNTEDALTNPTTGNPSYQPLQNAQIINTQNVTLPSGTTEPAKTYISSTYGACFTDTIGQLLTSDPSSGPGSGPSATTGLPYIVRDPSGNVIDQPTTISGTTYYPGLCSEYYLGPTSHDPTVVDTAKNQKGVESYGNDLVFRWRLNQSYNKSLNLLLNIQNANL